jgi:ComF family protein
VTSFKFSAKFDIGFALSKILARGINTYYRNKPMPQYLIPVPLHRKRQQLRGFNQALEISKVISADCSIPLLKSAVTKSKATLPQTEMASASARSSNLKGAFLLQQPQLIQNVTHIALIDDVVTTMATAETLAHLLQNHGIRRVDVWCIARANR